MTDLVWVVVRQDDNGNSYRVGHYATKDEAQRVADVLESRGNRQPYLIEHLGHGAS